MSESQASYGVSYIASSPEEYKVGDIVEVVRADVHRKYCLGMVGAVEEQPNPANGCVRVKGVDFKPEWLRKLPAATSFEDKGNPMDMQVGGDHYKKCRIEPAEYIHANGLDFFQGNIVKYITRFRDKDGKKDLEKIKHYCDMLIQMEYPE